MSSYTSSFCYAVEVIKQKDHNFSRYGIIYSQTKCNGLNVNVYQLNVVFMINFMYVFEIKLLSVS